MISPKRIIQKILNQFGYQLVKRSEPQKPLTYPFLDVLRLVAQDYMQHNPDIFFIQVGAHDGASADLLSQLIRQYHWRGILVEPQPEAFTQLITNYQGQPGLIFENAVIDTEDGTVPFYTVQEQDPPLPALLHQAASLNRDIVLAALGYWKRIEKHPGIPENFESLLVESQLPAVSIETLLSKHHVTKLDLLVVDAMGYDFKIIEMFPFELLKPAMIQFEHSQLSPSDRDACLNYLADLGYSFAKFAGDTVAYLQKPAFSWAMSGW
jgi:FkbM family methyltransferase